MKDLEYIAAYQKSIERQRVYIFLVGLDDWWDHNRDQWKKDSKKTSTVVVAEIKTEANVVEKASALVAAIDYGGLTS
ncbi:hypothetical protein CK203_042941 [Vitis vinifera]|uniref:Uncharacterized protein n=1 Tax=Vitis vinifera TaxID=29760 RepID=A0A438HUH6_VITVI|nr:hypothetical protein CK203_042941 [Vitis vinifera]